MSTHSSTVHDMMKPLISHYYYEDPDEKWVELCTAALRWRRVARPPFYLTQNPIEDCNFEMARHNILSVITFVRNEARTRFQENALETQEKITSFVTSLSQFEESLAASKRVMESHVHETAQLVSTFAPKLSSLEERLIEQEQKHASTKSELETKNVQLSQVVDQQAIIIKDLSEQQVASQGEIRNLQEVSLQQSHEIRDLTRTVGSLTETIMQLQNQMMALQGQQVGSLADVLRREIQAIRTLSRGSADISNANTDDDEKISF